VRLSVTSLASHTSAAGGLKIGMRNHYIDVEMGLGQNFSTRVGLGQFLAARVGSVIYGLGLDLENFP